MSESVIRKACDRCHAQKLSCKRYNDEPCERCVRLKTECRSSPSLRYRKNQQQLIESQQQGLGNVNSGNNSNSVGNSSLSTSTGRRSPKRRRTDSQDDPSLVSPDTGRCPLYFSLQSLSWIQPTQSRSSANSTPYRQPDV